MPKQSETGEKRVALTPPVCGKLVASEIEVRVESGAGLTAHQTDDAYREAGASIVDTADDDFWGTADIVATIHCPAAAQVRSMRRGAALVGMLAPLNHLDEVSAMAESGVTGCALEFLPRISRAQPMDVLSSQANIGGYKAAVLAADHGSKIYPMMMTAAGTIAPSRVFVIGAGVAGLQAIATAKRLGAVVEAFDVRPVVKEQVQSLGARFVELDLSGEQSETAGGYAKQQTDEQRQRQSELMARHVAGADAVITTAAIFGKAPPLLIPEDVVERMQPGAVIVDLAADEEAGRGNCALARPGEVYRTDGGVTIIGYTNLPALVPVHSSQAYSSNMHSFIEEIIGDDGLRFDLEDELIQGAAIVHDGSVRNELVAGALSGAPKD